MLRVAELPHQRSHWHRTLRAQDTTYPLKDILGTEYYETKQWKGEGELFPKSSNKKVVPVLN
jgi:hypothetical protein